MIILDMKLRRGHGSADMQSVPAEPCEALEGATGTISIDSNQYKNNKDMCWRISSELGQVSNGVEAEMYRTLFAKIFFRIYVNPY